MKKQGIMLAVLMVLAVFLFVGCVSTNSDVVENLTFWDPTVLNGVTAVTSDGLYKEWAQISPDGSKLIYCEKPYNQDDAAWNIVLLRDPTSPAKTQLVKSGFAPAWYENNTNFAYVTWENSTYKMLRTSIAGGAKTYITRNPDGQGEVRPTVKEGVILCNTAPTNSNSTLVTIRDNGNEYTMLGQGHSPSWHPFENKFLFIRGTTLYEMDAATTQVTELFDDAPYNVGFPTYSGDGQYILFQKGAEVKTTRTVQTVVDGKKKNERVVESRVDKWQIFCMKADGSEVRNLTEGNVSAYGPTWDKNNNIYFISDAKGKTEIYRATVNLE
ncbi:hypothetical protein AGMMS50293_08960 [Spirochaetia bacterium]|nr:hypothetical protein AGMMS50293_08960 [Spirochaetia bacterium]